VTERIVDFPARFAFVNPDGTLTSEARRMLRGWFMALEEPASSNDVMAVNVFAPRQTTSAAERALEGNADQILGGAAFLPRAPTFQAQQALDGNAGKVLESAAFLPKTPTIQAYRVLESNSNAILAGQIFGY
jgi:hypothetical protein